MHKVDDALPGSDLALLPEARAARRDAPDGRHAEHLGHQEAGAAEGTRAEVHEVKVADVAVERGVHVHRRDNDAVLELQIPEPERHEHRRSRRQALRRSHLPLRLVGEPLVDLSDKADVAQAQIVIGDPAAAREQVEDELDVGLVNVLRQVLEPLERWPQQRAGCSPPAACAPTRRRPGRPGHRLPVEAPTRARLRPPRRAWSPNQSRSAPCARRPRAARCCRGTSARPSASGSSATSSCSRAARGHPAAPRASPSRPRRSPGRCRPASRPRTRNARSRRAPDLFAHLDDEGRLALAVGVPVHLDDPVRRSR